MKAKTWFERLADGPVRTECLRIARSFVKEELMRCGVKISDVEASEINKAAIALCNAEIGILSEAKGEIKRQMKLKLKTVKGDKP